MMEMGLDGSWWIWGRYCMGQFIKRAFAVDDREDGG